MQLSFPIKKEPSYSDFQQFIKGLAVVQPSIILKAHVIAFGFDYSLTDFESFILQIKETYSYRKLESNPQRQAAYLSTILFNEIRSIEEALKDEKLMLKMA